MYLYATITLQVFLGQLGIKNPKFKLTLHHRITDLLTRITDRAQGSTKMGHGLKVALGHWL